MLVELANQIMGQSDHCMAIHVAYVLKLFVWFHQCYESPVKPFNINFIHEKVQKPLITLLPKFG